MSAIFVEIITTKGSTPRDVGTAMEVTQTTTRGTIGGGVLEHQAIEHARRILACETAEETQTLPLGPSLGQCCGGVVTLRYTREACPVDKVQRHVHPLRTYRLHPRSLWLWGAGHVGRAVVTACPPDAFKITWVDTAPDRFPLDVPGHVAVTPAADMPRLAAHAPYDAHHLIFTYSHDIDLALCAELLQRGTASIGLIGSATKWARFSKRLTAAGLDPSPIICPIGEKSRGKAPAQIAYGTIEALTRMTQDRVAQ